MGSGRVKLKLKISFNYLIGDKFSSDQHRFLWTAIRGFISEFGLFPWRVLSAQPSPFQALIKITKTAENSGARK